jgi:hypothetical protein
MIRTDFTRSFTGGMHNSICLLCDLAVASSAEPWILTVLEAAHVCSASDLLTHEAAFAAGSSTEVLGV